MPYDFSGYATVNDVKCSDGRVIRHNAFEADDGEIVPLVWQHAHHSPDNVLGHVKLENREDGVYAYGTFNATDAGTHALELVKHGDITALSIFANQLVQKGADVIHGCIREVSLVMAGANPGAKIDNLAIAHADGSVTDLDEEALIYSGEEIESPWFGHADDEDDEDYEDEDEDDDDETVADILESFSEKEMNVVYALVAEALNSAGDSPESMKQSDNLSYGGTMKHNVFSSTGADNKEFQRQPITDVQFSAIMADAQKSGSLKEAFLSHDYGITDIDLLFPDAKTLRTTPDFIKRETDWVSVFLSGTHHSPFSRIKSLSADITADAARALGYIKGNLKKEEVFGLLHRVTTPTTIYKKQKLDRDDIIDITDFDVVAWLKAEMRIMLEEEIARACLVGDGREVESDDKISEVNIRPIYKDNDLYAHHVKLESDTTTEELIAGIVRARVNYKGSGNPALFVGTTLLTEMLLIEDTLNHRMYRTEVELASALRVSKIVEVPVMDNQQRTVAEEDLDLIAIMINLQDYTIGADKGGKTEFFDDFDIDYNQLKYLLETRMCGALTKPKSALVFERIHAAG